MRKSSFHTMSIHFGAKMPPKWWVFTEFMSFIFSMCYPLNFTWERAHARNFDWENQLSRASRSGLQILWKVACIIIYHHWLVVYLPLWKIWLRHLGGWHSRSMESHKIYVPNHQAVVMYPRCYVQKIHSRHQAPQDTSICNTSSPPGGQNCNRHTLFLVLKSSKVIWNQWKNMDKTWVTTWIITDNEFIY